MAASQSACWIVCHDVTIGLSSNQARQRADSIAILTASLVAASRVRPSPNGTAASKGTIAISAKPATVRMRVTRPRSANENGPEISIQHGLLGEDTRNRALR